MPLNWKWRLVVALVGVALWCHPGVAAKIEHFKDTEGTLHITNAGEPEAAKPGAAAAPGATAVPAPSPQTSPSGSPPPPLPSPSVNHSAEPELAPRRARGSVRAARRAIGRPGHPGPNRPPAPAAPVSEEGSRPLSGRWWGAYWPVEHPGLGPIRPARRGLADECPNHQPERMGSHRTLRRDLHPLFKGKPLFAPEAGRRAGPYGHGRSRRPGRLSSPGGGPGGQGLPGARRRRTRSWNISIRSIGPAAPCPAWWAIWSRRTWTW